CVGPLEQNRVADHREAVLATVVPQIIVDTNLRTEIGAVAGTQIGVALLEDRVLSQASALTDLIGLGYSPDTQITGANGSDLSRPDQPVERRHGLLERCFRVIPVCVIEIEPVGMQTTKTLITLAFDLGGTKATWRSRVIEADLCRHLHLIASAAIFHPLADRCFTLA